MKGYYLRCHRCGGSAFTFRIKPHKGMKITKDISVEQQDGDIIKCGECKEIILNKYITSEYLGEKDERNS